MRKATVSVILVALLLSASGWALLRDPGAQVSERAQELLALLSPEQKEIALLEFADQRRVDWHFIPKPERKGLQYKDMNAEQKKATRALLRSITSQTGYDKATAIMTLETILHALETKKGTNVNIRDAERYYVTIFGEPVARGTWGLSLEGHHLSLNFTLKDSELTASTPMFFGANPAEVHSTVAGAPPTGTRVLAAEEDLAFELVNMLSTEQRGAAIIADKAPKDIRDAGATHLAPFEHDGIVWTALEPAQQRQLKALIKLYADNMPFVIAERRLKRIDEAGWEHIHFAWLGATKPGVGHHYIVSGPTFLIELNNTQPDPEGNLANHIHCMWRDLAGDFGLERK
jgi:hypothetical protein